MYIVNTTAKMDRSVAVLFRLGKALRYGDAEDFFQQYDALMERESLSDYAVMLQLQIYTKRRISSDLNTACT